MSDVKEDPRLDTETNYVQSRKMALQEWVIEIEDLLAHTRLLTDLEPDLEYYRTKGVFESIDRRITNLKGIADRLRQDAVEWMAGRDLS
jgi:hypothetical protein